MTFVIFAYKFLPANDPEAFCTARLANALGAAGHVVHVVTMYQEKEIPEEVIQALIPSVDSITRVLPMDEEKSVLSRIYYQTPEWDSVNYTRCIRKLTRVLKCYDSPILISRMCPSASGIVAWHCRKHAALWINHFSDPFPVYLKSGFIGSIMNLFTFRWSLRFLMDSDFCTITCKEVMKFFNEKFGRQDEKHFLLLPHIGDPLLPACEWENPFGDKPFIAHTGNFYDGRYADEIVAEMQMLGESGVDIGFLQAGKILESDEAKLLSAGIGYKQVKLTDPRQSTAIFNAAQVNLVVDLKTDLGYTPFIPSKFAYLLFTDRPIVAYAREDSWMCRLASDYPEAGIVFADVATPGSLANAVKKVLATTDVPDRTKIRKIFSSEEIVKKLAEKVETYGTFV